MCLHESANCFSIIVAMLAWGGPSQPLVCCIVESWALLYWFVSLTCPSNLDGPMPHWVCTINYRIESLKMVLSECLQPVQTQGYVGYVVSHLEPFPLENISLTQNA